ncbi:MAG: alkaline phosphatase family protein, partial [Vicinamibacteraceae bacterium]
MKKVLLLVIDAAAGWIVERAMEEGRLPTFRRLVEAGSFHPASTAIFPSITPAATASIVTGVYPCQHGIGGAAWVDAKSGDVAYYGDDFWLLASKGLGAFLDDFLVRLNHERLESTTMFQLVERAGRQATCLNHIIFRGDVSHRVRLPLLMRLLPGSPHAATLQGPSRLCLGQFVTAVHRRGKPVRPPAAGVLHRFGMDDAATLGLLEQLAEDRAFTDLTVAYCADNDYRSHEVGPDGASEVLERVDEGLATVLSAWGGLDAFLDEICLVVTSDHSQCAMEATPERAGIRLDTLLAPLRQADLAKGWQAGDEVMICPNLRTVQIYFREHGRMRIHETIDRVLADRRVDQVFWRAAIDRPGDAGFHVATEDRGRLYLRSGGGGEALGRDDFGNAWQWEGALDALDARVDEQGRLRFGDYPNAFERIACGLGLDESGDLWITARPGYEFNVAGASPHDGGGSHGALHRLDSTSPVILAGAPDGVALPEHMRTVDIVPLCLRVLDLPFAHAV